MDVAIWLAGAVADARRRGIGELEPLLETLARSTTALRAMDEEYRKAASGLPPAQPTDHDDGR